MSTTLISYGCYFMLISLLIGEMMLSSMLMRRIDKQDEEIRRLKHVIQKKVFENFKEKKPKKLKTPAKRSMIRDILENTDDYELVARKEGEEFVVRVRKPDILNEYVKSVEKTWKKIEEI